MKKIVVVLLISLVVVMGCSKKYAKVPDVKETADKSALKEVSGSGGETEVVKDISFPESNVSGQDIQESALPLSGKTDDSIMAGEVLFDFNKYTIREDARPRLNSSASYLRNKKQINIVIEGHGDERGTNEYNLALGEKRAKAVKNYFSALGISATRMTSITYGEERPVCTEQNEDCWQKNRRAHIVVQ